MKRRYLFIIAGAAAVALTALAVMIGAGQLREPVRAQMEQALGRPVRIDGIRLGLFPLAVRLTGFSVSEAPDFASRNPFVAADQVYVRVGFGALLSRQVRAESIRLIRPRLEWIRNAQGKWNTDSLGGAGGGSTPLEILDLRAEDGSVAVTDLTSNEPRAVYDHIDVTLRDYAPGKIFHLTAGARLPSKLQSLVEFNVSGLTPAPGKPLTGSDLDGTVTMKSVTASSLRAFLGRGAATAAEGATFDGSATFKSRGGTMSGNADIAIADPRLNHPAHVVFDVRHELEKGALAITNLQLKTGGVAGYGKFTAMTKATPTTVEGDVRIDSAQLAELLALASAAVATEGIAGTGTVSLTARFSGPTDDLNYQAAGSLRDSRIMLDTLSKPIEVRTADYRVGKNSAVIEGLNGSIGSSHITGGVTVENFAQPVVGFRATIDRVITAELEQLAVPSKNPKARSQPLTASGTLTIGSVEYNQVRLTNVQTGCKIANGVIRLDPLTAQLFGGQQSGSIAVDTRTRETAFEVNARLERVDAAQLLGSTSALGKFVSGMFAGDIAVRASPQAGQQIAQALNGTVKVQLTDGKLAGVQLLSEAASIAKFLGFTPPTAGFTDIVRLGGSLHIENGVATTNDLHLQFNGGTLTAAGTIGLADEQVKLRVVTVLPKDVSDRAGGSQIGGWMSTALANAKGELVIPAVVSGSLGNLHFAPDAERVAKMKLEGLLPTKDNPLGPATKVQEMIGVITGKKPAAAQNPQGTQPTEPQKNKGLFGGVLDKIREQADKQAGKK